MPITANYDKLFSQANEDMAQSLMRARDEIDAIFGAGHAAKNPYLVGMCVRAASENFKTTVLSKTLHESFGDDFGRLVDIASLFRAKFAPGGVVSWGGGPAPRPAPAEPQQSKPAPKQKRQAP